MHMLCQFVEELIELLSGVAALCSLTSICGLYFESQSQLLLMII